MSDHALDTPSKDATPALGSSGSSGSETDDYHNRKSWPNGKRPPGYRTKEGHEAAEKCKNYKSGMSVPHLSARCDTYEGVLKHAVLGAIRTSGFFSIMQSILDRASYTSMTTYQTLISDTENML